MEPDSGSRSSQESSLVGAFRPMSSSKSEAGSSCALSTSNLSKQTRQPRTGACSSRNPWDSPSWDEWLQICRAMGQPTAKKIVSNPRKENYRDHSGKCASSSGPKNQVERFSRATWTEFGGAKYVAPEFCSRNREEKRSHRFKGDVSASTPILSSMRHSRSVESLLEVPRASSSSMSVVSVHGMDLESGIHGLFSKFQWAGRENTSSIDYSHDSLDGVYGEPRYSALRSDRAGSSQDIRSSCGSRRGEWRQTPGRFCDYADVRSRSTPVSMAPHASGPKYQPETSFLESTSVELMQTASIIETTNSNQVVNGHQQEPSASVLRRPWSDMRRRDRQLGRWRSILSMPKVWWSKNRGVRYSMLKRQIRRGIPDELRGQAWMTLSGGRELRDSNPGVFYLLLNQPCNAEYLIRRDLHRTFPNHVYFQQQDGPGQKALFNVLRAYAVHDPEVCYVQGMGAIVAVLLLYMREEDAFWTFAALMKPPITGDDQKRCRRGIRSLYLQDLPLCRKLNMQFKFLLSKKCSQLSWSLEQEGYEPAMYATKWWMALFAFSLPFSHVVRVWDIFMLEGWKMGIRVGLAIMKTLEKNLVGCSFDTIIERVTPEHLGGVISSANDFIKTTLKIRVSRILDQWERSSPRL